MTGGGLVAVHAHPDDETLSTGALLATWAAAGKPTCVVTCTRGERGEVLALPGTLSEGLRHLEGDFDALAAYRETELERALRELGVREQVFLDGLPAVGAVGPSRAGALYVDSGMAWVSPGVAGPAPDAPAGAFSLVPLDEAAGRLAALLRERRPSVVATYEPGGGYGHPDHVRAHQVAVRALELAADPEAAVHGGRVPGEPWAGAELLQAVAPADEVRAARRALAAHPAARSLAAAEGLDLADPDEALPPFAKDELPGSAARGAGGGSDALLRDGDVVSCAVGPVLDRVLAAMRAFATQVQHVAAVPASVAPDSGLLGWYALSNGVLAPVMERETYLVRR
ncbi:PIG-L family deacetylase [Antribacter sp. KLBMP9083]|uniref:PIG-L family deacetylase n=1 Tax=Antribacter soli TaxID=2910976 RepID=A0AA41QF60_9MICO|nr:PIG-L family deacetylase [Antribacter soli]MCF4122320.1 PIG-L family deacetylase [Antribacter soli]